jgi:hypothetical protein
MDQLLGNEKRSMTTEEKGPGMKGAYPTTATLYPINIDFRSYKNL